MDIKEQAAFYKRCCEYGISLWQDKQSYVSLEQGVVDTDVFAFYKRPTSVDDRGLSDVKYFLTESEQLELAKKTLNWSWTPEPEVAVEPIVIYKEAEPEPVMDRFEISFMFDVGYGQQVLSLGELTTDYVGDDWQSDLFNEANKIAAEKLNDLHAGATLDKVPHKVMIIPKQK